VGFIGEQTQTAGLDGEEEAAPPKTIGRQRSGFFYYTVKPGDTLSELAREFDSTQLALLEYNNLPDTETVFAGLELRIPYGPPSLPVTTPPIPFSGSRFVVSLSRQQCWVLEGETVRYTWNCSTGYGEWITRTGNFAVQTKMEVAKSTAYELDMPYWLGIYDVGTYENGIHGLPIRWETGEKIWEGLIGQPATFGCAMLDDEDAETLYELAFLGMPVHIVP
jgi:LysM repeat protein